MKVVWKMEWKYCFILFIFSIEPKQSKRTHYNDKLKKSKHNRKRKSKWYACIIQYQLVKSRTLLKFGCKMLNTFPSIIGNQWSVSPNHWTINILFRLTSSHFCRGNFINLVNVCTCIYQSCFHKIICIFILPKTKDVLLSYS